MSRAASRLLVLCYKQALAFCHQQAMTGVELSYDNLTREDISAETAQPAKL